MFFSTSKKRSIVLFILTAFFLLFIPMILSFPANVKAATTLTTYAAPTGVTLDTTFTVKVRVPGGTWQDLDEYQTRIGGPSRASYASFVYFDCDGPVELSVTYNAGTVTSAAIRPSFQDITPTIDDDTATFTISGPMKLTFDVDGNVDNNLMIFANPLEVDPPSADDPDVIYLEPGYYTEDITVSSGETLYIAGGAVLKGGVTLDNAVNAKVIGRGVLDHPAYGGISANYANQITIEGIIINDFANYNNGGNGIVVGDSTNVTINNVKGFSYKKWSDGIDIYSSSNVTIEDTFMRTGDDCIAIYGSRTSYSGNCSNISVTDSILMPGKAHPINVGTHGYPGAQGGGDTIDTLNFSNLDILVYNPLSAGYALPISLTASDGNLVTDVNFTDIRIDDACVNRFIDIITYKNSGFSTAPGRGMNNVYLKNISYTGTNSSVNSIYGNSSTRLTQNVTFENLEINGETILSASDGNFTVGSYTNNINFIASGDTEPSTIPIPHPNPINLALNKTASTDSSQSANTASNGNDSSTTTYWCAADEDTDHWWEVDLGENMTITGGTQVMWKESGAYQYKIETSTDDVNWILKVDNTANTTAAQTQTDTFLATARYVRITVTGLPSGAWASFYDFKVFGEPVNLALNKTASADSSQSANPASSGSDGNAVTRWCANNSSTGHWWMVDLGENKNITNGTQVAWEFSGVYKYKIETSTDNETWTTAVDKTSNTDTSQIQSDYFTATARYVRITVTGMPSSSWASFYDFKVFGEPTNLALDMTASADSSQSTNPASYGNDSSTTTCWSAEDESTGHWWMVDLGESTDITYGTQVMWELPDSVYSFTIETSTDNETWTTVVDRSVNNTNSSQVYNNYFTSTARYVRVTVTGLPSGAYASLYDFKVLAN